MVAAIFGKQEFYIPENDQLSNGIHVDLLNGAFIEGPSAVNSQAQYRRAVDGKIEVAPGIPALVLRKMPLCVPVKMTANQRPPGH